MGLIDQLDELLTRAIQAPLDRERARAGARLLGAHGRAHIERLLDAPPRTASGSSARSAEAESPPAGGAPAHAMPAAPAPRSTRASTREDFSAFDDPSVRAAMPATREQRLARAERELGFLPTGERVSTARLLHAAHTAALPVMASAIDLDDEGATVAQRLRALAGESREPRFAIDNARANVSGSEPAGGVGTDGVLRQRAPGRDLAE